MPALFSRLAAVAILAASASALAQEAPIEGARLAGAREKVKALQAEIERISPRRFKSEVGVGFQTDEEFRAYALRQMEKDLPAEKAEAMSAGWIALGLLAEGTDLRKALVDAIASQAAAYYDPEKDTFYVVKAGIPEMFVDGMFLHELEHAMQDQVLGLDRIVAAASSGENDDRGQALRFLFEGEANYLSTSFDLKRLAGIDVSQPGPIADAQFRQQATMGFDQLVEQMDLMKGMLGPDMQKSVEDMKTIPRFIIRGLLDAYLKGQLAIHLVKKAKGWEGVDALFKDPPTSTEQMLHPREKLLGEKREEPIPVALPDLGGALPAGAKKLHENTVGEHAIQILLTDQLPKGESRVGNVAAAGWGGDRFAAYRLEGSARPLLAWLTAWDTEGDAKEFETSYAKAAAARNEARGWPAASVARKGAWVVVVEGEEGEAAGKLSAALLAAAK